ncbi:MAG: protein kinase domain-containing protein [Thermoguttaceae bacterium]
MAAHTGCPDTSVIESMLAGNLTAEEEAKLAEHLESCARCQRTFESLAKLDEGMHHGLADPDREPTQIPDTLMQKLAGAIRIATRDGTAANSESLSEEIDLGFLQDSEEGNLGRLGAYEILEIVGRGGMGIVFKGHDARLNRCVAIKVLVPQLAANAAARKRFLREAQAAAAVSHEHVVRTYAVDESNGIPFIVMEYIEGISLDARIKRDGPLGIREILRIGMQSAAGLAAAHAQGLVHRDIKPSNILLENGVERVKITDFGLARAAEDAQITQTGVLTGTPQYMSPEQARGEATDQRSDLFSLGCVLYAMCTGRSPFRATTVVDAIRRVCDDTPRALQQVNPDLPDWLVATVEQLLEKDPEKRFSSAAELAELLGEHLAGIQLPAMPARPRVSRSAERPERPRRGPSRRTWLVATIVSLAFVGLVLTESMGVTQVARKVADHVRRIIAVPEPTPPPKQPEDGPLPANAIDLLALIDPQRDAAPRGYWRAQNGALTVRGEGHSCRIPYVFPDEYDVVAVVQRDSGDKALAFAPTFAGRQCYATIDWAPEDGCVSALLRNDLTCVKDGYLGQLLHERSRATICWSVRRDGDARSVRAVCDGKLAFEWQGLVEELLTSEATEANRDSTHCIRSSSHAGVNRILRLYLIPHSKGGHPFFTEGTTSPERVAAERVLWQQGTVSVSVDDGKEMEIRDIRDLPETFSLRGLSVSARQSSRLLGANKLPVTDLRNLRRLVLKGPLEIPNDMFLNLRASPSLQEVALANTPLTDAHLADLGALPELKSLDLQFTQITDEGLAALARAKTLRRLCLGGTKISDEGIGHLEGMKQMEYLDLTGTRVSNNVCDSLCKLGNLREVRLDYTAIDDVGAAKLAEMPQLARLSVSGTDVSDAGVSMLQALTALTELSLVGNPVSEKCIQILQEKLPECTIVHSAGPPVNILKTIRSDQQMVNGSHRWEGESVAMSAQGWGYLKMPYSPPDEYLLEVDAECVSGLAIAHFGLVLSKRTFAITCPSIIDDRHVSGLEQIDGSRVDFNETTHEGLRLTHKKPFSLSVLVTDGRIAAKYGECVFVDWSGDIERLSKCTDRQPDGLCISPYKNELRVDRMELRPIVRTHGGQKATSSK